MTAAEGGVARSLDRRRLHPAAARNSCTTPPKKTSPRRWPALPGRSSASAFSRGSRRSGNGIKSYLAAAGNLTHGRRSPVAEWLDGLGVFGLHSLGKVRPGTHLRAAGRRDRHLLAAYLWATDGCVRPPQGKAATPQSTTHRAASALARDVQSLLVRVGINAVLRPSDQGTRVAVNFTSWSWGAATSWRLPTVSVPSARTNRRPCRSAGSGSTVGRQSPTETSSRGLLESASAVPAMRRQGVTMRQLQGGLGIAFMGTGLYKQNVSRQRLARVAAVLDNETLDALAREVTFTGMRSSESTRTRRKRSSRLLCRAVQLRSR